MTRTTDSLNNTRTFLCTPALSKAVGVAGSLGNATALGHYAQDKLIAISDPEQNTKPEAERLKTRFTYNPFGQPLSITDPLGQTTSFTYNAEGDLISITDPLNRTVQRGYDLVSRLLLQLDPLGRSTRFGYGALNQLVALTDALGGTTGFTYDPNGNLLTLTDPRGGVTRYSYDGMDRVATRTDPLLRAESFQYDLGGNLTQVTDRKGQVTAFSYDALSRRTQAAYADASTISYSYDAADRLTQVVDSLAGTITRTYDPLDRLLSETTPQGTVSYSYDAAGRRTQMTVTGQAPVTSTFDRADRLTGITQGTASVSLAYDPAGKRTSLTLPNGILAEYSYDAAGQLTGLTYRLGGTVLGNLTYGYDGAGSRIQVGGTWARTGLPQPVASATYDAANQPLTWGAQALTYDANGNLTGDGTTTYTWNARNQLSTMTGASFAYDGLGRRMRKSVGATTTDFLYDGLTPVQELSGGSPTATLLTGLGIDEYIARTDAAGTRTFLSDALGSTLALADDTGVVQTEYTYEPFGGATTSGEPTSSAFQYTGRENDGTGLYYYRARFYHPGFHRFISEDVFPLADDSNRYLYVRNMPTELTDPSGEIAINAGAALAGAGIGVVVGAVGAAITPGATLTSVAVGAGAGAVVGATAGFTLGTSVALNAVGGAVVGALGDIMGQAATNWVNGNAAFERINWDSATIGAIAGATSFGLAAWAARGGASVVEAALAGAAVAAGIDIGMRVSIRSAHGATPPLPPPLPGRK